jgi:hypothetical protein
MRDDSSMIMNGTTSLWPSIIMEIGGSIAAQYDDTTNTNCNSGITFGDNSMLIIQSLANGTATHNQFTLFNGSGITMADTSVMLCGDPNYFDHL